MSPKLPPRVLTWGRAEIALKGSPSGLTNSQEKGQFTLLSTDKKKNAYRSHHPQLGRVTVLILGAKAAFLKRQEIIFIPRTSQNQSHTGQLSTLEGLRVKRQLSDRPAS